jgi:hypothetical protein
MQIPTMSRTIMIMEFANVLRRIGYPEDIVTLRTHIFTSFLDSMVSSDRRQLLLDLSTCSTL